MPENEEVVVVSEEQKLDTPNMTDEELREWIKKQKEQESS